MVKIRLICHRHKSLSSVNVSFTSNLLLCLLLLTEVIRAHKSISFFFHFDRLFPENAHFFSPYFQSKNISSLRVISKVQLNI